MDAEIEVKNQQSNVLPSIGVSLKTKLCFLCKQNKQFEMKKSNR
jgi:hypothetical protein